MRIKRGGLAFLRGAMLVRTCLSLLALVSACLLAAHASARTTAWAMRSGNVTLMTFGLERHHGRWSASWRQPTRCVLDGDRVSHIGGPVLARAARRISIDRGSVTMVFANPFPNGQADVLVISRLDDRRSKLRWNAFAGLDFVLSNEPASTMRAEWNAAASYRLDVNRSVDAEMTAMFEADQSARRNPTGIDWNVLRAADADRRARTLRLLEAGRLSSAIDYYHAAYMCQHGYAPNDYLRAHVLAMVAVERGYDAGWIAAATLDRYLQSIGRPQVFGTQFREEAGSYTQEPFDRMLLKDAERSAGHVPGLVDQETQRQRLGKSLGR